MAVEGDRIAAVGPLAELDAEYPKARVRRWS
ncbi:imidazolonepropionase-like domain-containing protein, partial [Streptomyces megasporus]